MSHYKSAIHAQSQQESSDSPNYRQACQLKELFSSWTIDDLQLLLSEVNGDVDLAATKISDGTAVPWGEVSRKKDKKVPTPAHTSKPSTSGRGDFRGARGGRGGRGGGRGGAVARGGRGSSKSGANGHALHVDSPHAPVVTNGVPSDHVEGKPDAPNNESHEQHNVTPSTSGWTDSPSQPENLTTATVSGNSMASTWGHTTEDNGNTATHAAAPRQASKTPATSKLSWAQIARPQEKATSQAQPSVVAPETVPSVPIPETQSELEQNGWEKPTTAEPPSWDEPKHAEVWAPTEASPEAIKAESLVGGVAADSEIQEGPKIGVPEIVTEPSETTAAPSVPVVAQTSIRPQVTPSPKLTTRHAVSSHRSSARHKIPDQPVTLPLSFGSGIEKVGMQFGSLNLGDSVETSQPESEAIATIPEPTPAPVPQSKVDTPPVPAPLPATAPATSTSMTSVFQQQQQLPPSVPQPQLPLPSAQSSVPHHSLPSSVSQPIVSSQTAVHATASPLQSQTSAQPPITHNIVQQQPQHVSHLPQQLQQNQAAHSFNQHNLPLHLEPSQQTQTPIQQQPPQSATHSTYFRGADASATAPYFHAPTPPVAQAQDNSYGSFGQLGTQNQHQQPPHLGAFGSNDYGYSDATRDFYNSYPQQQGFASRNPLGHEDVKALSGGQQSSASTVPPSSAQGPPTHASQGSNQPQTTGGQGPQQYPPPVPYYYPAAAYGQGQYYGSPYNSGYVPQPFVKYPTMFQPAPGPGSTTNPATKQPGGNAVVGVQPQTNPYSQLYQQGGYEDYQAHPHHAQHHHQHSHSLGLGQGGVGDYSKPLYSGAGGNIQGFMGLGGQTGGPTSNAGPRGGSSPDTHYKPYTSKDVGVAGGRSVPNQGQVPPQSQNQGPAGQGSQGQSFYPGNRFGSGVSSSGGGGPGGPQQSGPQGHLAYPQAVNEPSYYGYQPRQQPFWP